MIHSLISIFYLYLFIIASHSFNKIFYYLILFEIYFKLSYLIKIKIKL